MPRAREPQSRQVTRDDGAAAGSGKVAGVIRSGIGEGRGRKDWSPHRETATLQGSDLHEKFDLSIGDSSPRPHDPPSPLLHRLHHMNSDESRLAGKRILIAGCGYVGSRAAEMLVGLGAKVYGLRRSQAPLPQGVALIQGDVTDPASLDLPDRLDAVVYAVSPADRDAAAYRAAFLEGPRKVLDQLGWEGPEAEGRTGRVILVSSTGVYGQSDGRWVDEETPPDPADESGAAILEAEEALHARCPDAVVLRLGGIYGPGRDWTIRQVRAGEAGCPPEGLYTNRIHREDAAGAVVHLLQLTAPPPLVLGVDSDPAQLRDIYRWIAARIDAPDPCQEGAPSASEPFGRRGTNKRCSGRRLVDSGYDLRFSTFREGYASLLDAGS